MKFNTEFEAQQYGHAIGASHYKKSGDDYRFIKSCGEVHPIIEPSQIKEYMTIGSPFARIIALARQPQKIADLMWFEEYKEWFAYSCCWNMSGLLRDDAGVKKLELEYN